MTTTTVSPELDLIIRELSEEDADLFPNAGWVCSFGGNEYAIRDNLDGYVFEKMQDGKVYFVPVVAGKAVSCGCAHYRYRCQGTGKTCKHQDCATELLKTW